MAPGSRIVDIRRPFHAVFDHLWHAHLAEKAVSGDRTCFQRRGRRLRTIMGVVCRAYMYDIATRFCMVTKLWTAKVFFLVDSSPTVGAAPGAKCFIPWIYDHAMWRAVRKCGSIYSSRGQEDLNGWTATTIQGLRWHHRVGIAQPLSLFRVPF